MHYLINSINAGEMSPQMDVRVDNEKYNAGARVLENFIVKPYGGIYKRPGTQFMDTTFGNQVARIEGFSRNQLTNFILEFTPGALRVVLVNDYEGNNDPETVNFSSLRNNVEISSLAVTDNARYRPGYSTSFLGAGLSGWEAGQSVLSGTGTHRDGQLFVANVDIASTSFVDCPLSGAAWTDYWTPVYYKPNDVININVSIDGQVYDFAYKCLQTNNIAISAAMQYSAGTSSTYAETTAVMTPFSAYWEPLPYSELITTTNNIPIVFNTPYAESELFELQVESINDVVLITHKNHRPRKLSRIYNGFWTFEPIEFEFAPALDVDISTNVVQIQYNFDEWVPNKQYFIGDRAVVTTAAYSTLSAISATGLFTCTTLHTSVSTSNSQFGKPGSTTGAWQNNWNQGSNNAKFNNWAANVSYVKGQTIFYGKSLYQCILAHTSDANTFFTTVKKAQKTFGLTTPTKGKLWTKYWRRVGATTDLVDIKYKLASEQDIFTPTSVGETWQIRVPVANYFRRLELASTAATQTLEPSDEIFLQGPILVSSRWDTGYAPVGTYYLEESVDGVTWTEIQVFVVESEKDNNISFTYEAPTKGAWYRLSGQRNGDSVATARARSLLLEPANSILTVPFLITDYVDANDVLGKPTFNNNQIMPEEAVGISTSYYKRPAFSASTGYPASVALHESRLWFGGVETQPARVWGSQKDDFYNFLLGVNATDAIDLTLAAKMTNRIKWMKSFNRQLVVATDGEIYTIDAGESDAAISPTTVRGRVRLYNGGCAIPGSVTTDSLLYFQNGNKRLREFAYNFQTDSFVAPDLTVLAEHINGTGFKQMALMQNPEPVLWSINYSGELVGLSYDRAQNVTAWHRHTTGGPRISAYAPSDEFVSVATVYGQQFRTATYEDQVWMVVKRVTGGTAQTYYNLERFNPNVMHYIYGGLIGDDAVVGGDQAGELRYGYLDSSTYSFDRDVISGETVYDFTPSVFDPNNTTNERNESLRDRLVAAVYSDGESLSSSVVYPSSGTVYKIKVPSVDSKTALAIGIPVYSLFIPARFDVKLDNGTSMGRKHRINRVQFKPWRTVGGKFCLLDSFKSTLSAGMNLATLPTLDTPASNIVYQDFNFNVTADKQLQKSGVWSNIFSTRPWLQTYSGSTADVAINMNWTDNPLFAVIHYDAAPFNLLGMVWKLEVQGN